MQTQAVGISKSAHYGELLPHLEPVAFGMPHTSPERTRASSYSPPIAWCRFFLHVLASGASTEIAVTGNEGLVGISLFMGGETTPSRAVVQSAGHGYRLRAAILKRQFGARGELQHLLLRFTQALITQMTQTAVCTRSTNNSSSCSTASPAMRCA